MRTVGSSRKDKDRRQNRQDRHDVYQGAHKPESPSVCSGCGAVYRDGRWSWGEAPPGEARAVCPACRRIADRFPAGRVELAGDFLREHRDEIFGLVRNEERGQRERHPLERIMAVEEGEPTVITTTGVHVARRIGEALARAYGGDLAVHYGDGESSVRVSWSR